MKKVVARIQNPFNPSIRIAFDLPKASHVSLIITDVPGREIAEIANRNYPAGNFCERAVGGSELTAGKNDLSVDGNESACNFYNLTANSCQSAAGFYRVANSRSSFRTAK